MDVGVDVVVVVLMGARATRFVDWTLCCGLWL
jgi:hypothetical protein